MQALAPSRRSWAGGRPRALPAQQNCRPQHQRSKCSQKERMVRPPSGHGA